MCLNQGSTRKILRPLLGNLLETRQPRHTKCQTWPSSHVVAFHTEQRHSLMSGFFSVGGGNKDLVVKVEPKLESQTYLQPRIRNLLRAKHYLLPRNTYLLQARRPSLFPEHRDRKLAAHQVMKTKTIKKNKDKKKNTLDKIKSKGQEI